MQYCIDKRYLQVKTYCYHNIHLMSKRSLYIKIFYCLFKCLWIINVCFDVPWKATENLNT